MTDIDMVMAVATINVRVDGERVKHGTPFPISRRELDEMSFASECKAEDKTTPPDMTPEERAEKILNAVLAAVIADPERTTQPTVAIIAEKSGLTNVKAAEITTAFEAPNKDANE